MAVQVRSRGRQHRSALFGGGTGGNEQITATAGVILIFLLAALGVTILRIRQLISIHLFLGFLLLGPVALKMAATGYRFARYYTGSATYRHKGPPEPWLRVIAPIVVVSTVVVFATGIILLFLGPRHRDPWLALHKVSFIVWLVFTGLHVLGHLPRLGRSLRIASANAERPGLSHGAAGRLIVLGGAVVGGAVLAIVLIPHYATWTAHGAFPHHHHG